MKKLWLAVLFLASTPAFSATPDTLYFNAMKDEMARNQKYLKLEHFPRPFFQVYKLVESKQSTYLASLGELVATPGNPNETVVDALVYAPIGTAKVNSIGFGNNKFYSWPSSFFNVPKSYDGIRAALWESMDYEYIVQLDNYAKKDAYKRQYPSENLPDFSAARRGEFYEEARFEPVDNARYEQVVQTLSAFGKNYKHIEKFTVSLTVLQQTDRYLNSEKSFFQQNRTLVSLALNAQLRNKDGLKLTPVKIWRFTSLELLPLEELSRQTNEFLKETEAAYDAKKAEPYLGPVLLTRSAAVDFFNILFVRNINFSRPFLMPGGIDDASAGAFKDKIGLRVLSHLFNVEDRPTQRRYKGEELFGFMPVDDEGVQARDITLVKNGKLTALPTTRSLINGQKESNGHARMTRYLLPRAVITNLFFLPKETWAPEQLEEKLLARCKELDLEYCYIVNGLDGEYFSGNFLGASAARIYTADGRKEPVHSVKLQNIGPRSLRDIIAAGDDAKPEHFFDSYGNPVSIVAPSVLVDEFELVPSDDKPERKPFVSQPK